MRGVADRRTALAAAALASRPDGAPRRRCRRPRRTLPGHAGSPLPPASGPGERPTSRSRGAPDQTLTLDPACLWSHAVPRWSAVPGHRLRRSGSPARSTLVCSRRPGRGAERRAGPSPGRTRARTTPASTPSLGVGVRHRGHSDVLITDDGAITDRLRAAVRRVFASIASRRRRQCGAGGTPAPAPTASPTRSARSTAAGDRRPADGAHRRRGSERAPGARDPLGRLRGRRATTASPSSVVWQLRRHAGHRPPGSSGPTDVERESDGSTLIADARADRVVRVNGDGTSGLAVRRLRSRRRGGWLPRRPDGRRPRAQRRHDRCRHQKLLWHCCRAACR